MIVVLKQGTQQKEIDKLTDQLSAQGVEVNPCLLYTSIFNRERQRALS